MHNEGSTERGVKFISTGHVYVAIVCRCSWVSCTFYKTLFNSISLMIVILMKNTNVFFVLFVVAGRLFSEHVMRRDAHSVRGA